MDGRHFLLGAPEVTSEKPKPHCHLLRLLPLQSHHCEAADVAQCCPGEHFDILQANVDLVWWQFIDEPLAYLTVYYTRIAAYVSPNGMSFIGVMFGAAAAKFFVKEELKYRQFGVLLFAVSSLSRNILLSRF